MASDWITVAQAAGILDRPEEEVGKMIEDDSVETLSAGDVEGQIQLVPRDYVETKKAELEAEAEREKERARKTAEAEGGGRSCRRGGGRP